MKYKALTPMIRTKEIKETIAFYTDTLGFACTAGGPDAGWATLSHNGVNIMVAAPNDHLPFDRPTFTGSLYLYTDDADEVWSSVKDRASICYPIETFDYGMREFGIFDNNGYLLQFGQPAGK
jgi:uncharacterized glyoxalase superfamily protein PhnB